MITSLERSFSVRKPSASSAPMSPVHSQPSRSVAARGLGVAPVAGHHRVAAHQHLADLAGRAASRPSASATRTSTSVCATPTEAMRSAWRGCAASAMVLARQRGDRHRRSRPGRRSARSAGPSPPARAWMSADVHRPAAVDDGLERRRSVGRAAGLDVVDQALDHGRRGEHGTARPTRRDSANSSAGSKPPEAGTTCRAARATKAEVVEARSRATSARRRRWRRPARRRRRRRSSRPSSSCRLRCVMHHALGPAGRARGVEQPGQVVGCARAASGTAAAASAAA